MAGRKPISIKRILFFSPVNPIEQNEGNKTRILQLLQYFKSRAIEVDFVSLYDHGSQWQPAQQTALRHSGLVNELTILDRKPSRRNILKYFLLYKVEQFFYEKEIGYKRKSLPHQMSHKLAKDFAALVSTKQYDAIVVSYAYWADLIRGIDPQIYTILDTHDFLTAQHYRTKKVDVGIAFGEEIRRLRLFDEVWTVSTDEEYIFSQFLLNVKTLPVSINSPKIEELACKKFDYDLVYVGSDNKHNQDSAEWFFKYVFPLLGNVRLCVVGLIGKHLPDNHNIIKIPFVENLSSIYLRSYVAICPMLSGTGLKIKVVEALAFGIPVVCNTRGLDGLPNKINNGCIAVDEPLLFAEAINNLLSDNHLYLHKSAEARQCYENSFSAQAVEKKLDATFHY